MSWYSQMMKSQELARARNQRMERRLQGERHGPQFVAQTRIAALDKEKRMIEKELERIRKGIHKPPKHGDSAVKNKGSHILAITSPTRMTKSQLGGAFLTSSVDSECSNDAGSKLYDAIVFLQNNPSALVPIISAHAQGDAFLEKVERITPRMVPETKETHAKQPFVPRYLQEINGKGTKSDNVNKYTYLLQRHTPEPRRNSPYLKSMKQANSSRDPRESPFLRENNGNFTQRSAPVLPPIQRRPHDASDADASRLQSTSPPVDAVDTARNEDTGSKTQNTTSYNNTSHQAQDVSDQANADVEKTDADDMQGTKENRRMSSQHAVDNQMLVSGEHRHSIGETAPDIKARNVTEEKPHKKHHQKPINPPMYHDNNPEHYNADGTLRTQYQMPSSDTAWEQAQKARYIRSKDAVERDRELSVKEIFRKKDN